MAHSISIPGRFLSGDWKGLMFLNPFEEAKRKDPLKVNDKVKLNGWEFEIDITMYERCGSAFAIQGGRIFQLSLYKSGELVAEYDRGWEIKPDGADDETDIALSYFIAKYNRPRVPKGGKDDGNDWANEKRSGFRLPRKGMEAESKQHE